MDFAIATSAFSLTPVPGPFAFLYSQARIKLVQTQQKDYEDMMEKIMISGSENGRGTKCRYKCSFESKRLSQNAEALRKKERFKEAHKFQRQADKLDKMEKATWFKRYLHLTVGDHPNSTIAKLLEQHKSALDMVNDPPDPPVRAPPIGPPIATSCGRATTGQCLYCLLSLYVLLSLS